MLFIRSLETYCSYPYVIAVAVLVWSKIPIRIWALIRIWAKQEFWPIRVYGLPVRVYVWAAHTRTGIPYAYGLPVRVWAAHMHMGQPIRVWAEYLYGTEQ